jgi:hypothetical protein
MSSMVMMVATVYSERKAERLPPEAQGGAHEVRSNSRPAMNGEAGRRFVSSVSLARRFLIDFIAPPPNHRNQHGTPEQVGP